MHIAAAFQSCFDLQVERLYTGPQDADIVEHVKACNPRGPLLVHIAKLYPKQDCSTFDAFGRVFSGTVKPGDRVSPKLVAAILIACRADVSQLVCEMHAQNLQVCRHVCGKTRPVLALRVPP